MTDTGRVGTYLDQVRRDVLQNRTLRNLLPAFVGVFLVSELYKQALPLYFEAAGISLAFLGILMAIANAVEIGASPIAGALADQIDRMRIAAWSGGLSAIVLAMFLVRPGIIGISFIVVFTTLSLLFLNNSITPAINAALEDGVDGIGWGIRDFSMYVGSAIGLAGASWLLAHTDRVELVFLFAVPILVAIAVLSWHRTDDSASMRSQLREIHVSRGSDIREQFASVSDRRLLYLFCLVEFTTTAGMSLSMFLLPVLATDLGLAASGYLLVYSMSRLIGAPASLVGGVITDHIPKKWLFVGNYAVEGLMLLIFAVAGGSVLFLIGMALFVAQTTFEPGVLAYFFENFTDEEGGTIWGIKGSVSKAASVVAPPIGGSLFVIDPALPFLLGSGLLLAGAVIATRLPR